MLPAQEYLSIRLVTTLTELVDLTVGVWLAVEAVFIVLWAFMFVVSTSLVHNIGGVAVVGLALATFYKLQWIVKQLTPRSLTNSSRAARRASVGAAGMTLDIADLGVQMVDVDEEQGTHEAASATSDHSTDGDDEAKADGGSSAQRPPVVNTAPMSASERRIRKLTQSRHHLSPFFSHPAQSFFSGFDAGTEPPFLLRKVQKRGKCSRRCLGRPASQQEQLFWFDRHGRWFLLLLVQLIVTLASFDVGAA